MLEKPQEKMAMIQVSCAVRDKVLSLKQDMRFNAANDVVEFLLMKSSGTIKPAIRQDIMNETVPVVLTGKPLSGKTFFIRNNVVSRLWHHSILVIDTWNEYKEIQTVGYELNSFNFREMDKKKIRFVPNKRGDIAEREIERLFEDLDMKRDELANWVIIVEEAHAYKNIPSFMKFLYGSRRIVRKMIVVTPQLDAFEGLETFTVYRKGIDI